MVGTYQPAGYCSNAVGLNLETSWFQVGENGTLKGTVKDGSNNETLPGATVSVEGTGKGTATDVNGGFTIPDLKPGVYTIIVSFVGFEQKMIKDVQITAGSITTINVNLETTTQFMEEIEIVGDPIFGSERVINTTDEEMVNKIKSSSLNITGISTSQILKSVDTDASQVIRRAPSVSVVDNFVNIRGLFERYNFTFINGMQAPSSKPDGKAFSFDMIPSGIIDNILIYRSPAPELPADFAGGVVDIGTKQSLTVKQIQIGISGHFRENATFNDQYTYNSGSKTDRWGFDDGSRSLPSNFPVDNFPSASGNSASPRDLQKNAIAARALPGGWNVRQRNVDPDYRASLFYYDSWRIGENGRLSNATSVNYSSTSAFREQSFLINEALESYTDTLSEKNSRLGAFQSLKYKINDKHSLMVSGFFNQIGEDRVTIRDGFNDQNEGNFEDGLRLAIGSTPYMRQVDYFYRSRTIASGFLKGEHNFGGEENGHSISWLGGYTYSKEDRPERLFRYFTDSSRTKFVPLLDGFGGFSQGSVGVQYFLDVEEDTYTGRLDYQKKWENGFFVKAGYFYDLKDRKYFSRLYSYGLPSVDPLLPGRPELNLPLEFVADSLFNNWVRPDGRGLILLNNLESFNVRFDAQSTLHAGYIGLNIPLFARKLNIYGGLRYEWFNQTVARVGPDAELLTDKEREFQSPNQTTEFYLPSVNITYNIKKSLKLRSSYGVTLNRPHLRELAPNGDFDFTQGISKVGFPFLKTSRIQNADLRLEWYGGKGEIAAVGLFYKFFKNPIEFLTRDQPELESGRLPSLFFATNTKSATNYGVELELRKNLAFIDEKLKNISFVLNGSFLRSRVEYPDSLQQAFFQRSDVAPEGEIVIRRILTGTGVERALTGTSPYMINAGVYYDDEKTKTSYSAQYNVFGPRIIIPPVIVVIPTGGQDQQFREIFSPGLYEAPRHALDITVRQKIFSFLGLKLGVQNVLGQSVRIFMDRNQDEKFTEESNNAANTNDVLRVKYNPGRYYTVGLSFIF